MIFFDLLETIWFQHVSTENFRSQPVASTRSPQAPLAPLVAAEAQSFRRLAAQSVVSLMPRDGRSLGQTVVVKRTNKQDLFFSKIRTHGGFLLDFGGFQQYFFVFQDFFYRILSVCFTMSGLCPRIIQSQTKLNRLFLGMMIFVMTDPRIPQKGHTSSNTKFGMNINSSICWKDHLGNVLNFE